MGVSVVNYTVGDSVGSSWGVMLEGHVHALQGDYKSHREVMACYFSDRAKFDSSIAEEALDTQGLQFNSPVTPDVQLFCQGLNYADHRTESGASDGKDGDEENLIFMKGATSICAPNETIQRPSGCQLLDYEIELALVLKTEISQPTDIEDSDLSKYVGGLVLCNDVSARDFMFGAPMIQWFRGKSQRTFCPMGPVLYLMDEGDFSRLYDLQLKLTRNSEVMQSASTELLIHRPASTLTEISSFANFAVGDCLLTGTPGGVLAKANMKVGMAILQNFQDDAKRRREFTEAQLEETRFLEPGDVLELSIKTPDGAIDLGVQRNEIADVKA